MDNPSRIGSDPEASDDLLWHYTNLEALTNIVKGEKVPDLASGRERNGHWLWATHRAYLNDALESLHCFDVLSAALDAVNSESFVDKGRVDQITYMKEHLSTVREIRSSEEGPYIVCFSTARDSLSQWRAYGRPGSSLGCSIGFKPEALREAGISLTPVKYLRVSTNGAHDPDIASVLAEIIDVTQPERDDKSGGGPGRIGGHGLQADLRRLSAQIKHPSFADEHEVRFVENLGNGYGVHYRTNPTFGFAPYIKVPFSGMKDAIASIILAPTPHPNESRQAVTGWAHQHISSSVQVQQSASPYRNW